MNQIVINARGLTKRYGKKLAVNGIDFSVNAGEVVGLLGPNGAGKTTTILMLLGLTDISAGTIEILGHDPLRQPLAVKRQVGYLPDSVGFYDNMTGRENLNYTARLSGLRGTEAAAAITAALERVRLSEVADMRVRGYSHGMKKRLGIAELLMRECRIAILDEPSSGLDPQANQDLLDLIRELSQDGMTILLSSHMLDAVQSVCHRVALFNHGRIGFFGTTEELAAKIGGGAYVIDVAANGLDFAARAPKAEGVISVTRLNQGQWQVEAERDIRPELARLVVEGGGDLRNMDLHRTRLDEAYNRYFTEFANEDA